MLSRRETIDLFNSKVDELTSLKKQYSSSLATKLKTSLDRIVANDLIPSERKIKLVKELNAKLETAKQNTDKKSYDASLASASVNNKVLTLQAEVWELQQQIIRFNETKNFSMEYPEYKWPDCPSQECTCKYCEEEKLNG